MRLAERRIWVGDESRELLSGEVHFWRLDRSVWPKVLSAVRELGLDIISTYVAWNAHELEPGRYDFTGESDPRLDLIGFLELAQQHGLWVLIRPGPYIYAEWPNSGIPDRAVRWHRSHPAFREEARRWIAAVGQAVGPYQATRGGPIVMLQADNEADPWTDVYRSALDTASTPVEWMTSPRQLPRLLDFLRQRHQYATDVVRWSVGQYRACGVDVPIYANAYVGTSVQDWQAIHAECDLIGPDIYPTAGLSSSAEEHRGVLESIRHAHALGPLAFIPEFEAGIWHGWHRHVGALGAKHYVFLGLSALQAGASGWNWYMLVNRDNWYQSPINELGRARPDVLPGFEEVVAEFRELGPSRLDKVTSTAVTLDALERAAATNESLPLLQALYAADIDYEFCDVSASEPLDKPLVLYGGAHWASAAAQARLLQYVERGGTLVLFQTLPLRDDALESLNTLGLLDPDGVTTASHPQRVRVLDVTLSSPGVFVYSRVPGDPIVAERVAPGPPKQEGGGLHVQLPVGERITCGYEEVRGAGRLIVLGVQPSAGLLVALHRWLGVPIASRFDAAGLTSAVFRRGDELVAICTNITDFEGPTLLALDVEGFPREVRVPVPAHAGTWLSVRPG